MARAFPVLLVLLAGCGAPAGSIGAMLSKSHTDGRVLVREVPSDMEAARSGLRPGDEVLFIDGRDVRRLSAAEVHEALVGPIGSDVSLTVARGSQVVRLRVRRGALR
jgi:carboxyl-terminal processing protease